MAHADASRANQSLIHQSQLLFGNGKQRHQSPICQATPHDVRSRSILRRKGTWMTCKLYSLFDIYIDIKLIGVTANYIVGMLYWLYSNIGEELELNP